MSIHDSLIRALTVVLFAVALSSTPTVEAQPPAGWTHQQIFHVSNDTGAALTGFQVGLQLDTATPIAAGEMLAGGDDLRVTADCASTAFLPLWLESPDTTTTVVWVRVDIPVGGTNLYVYWGNPAATPISDPFSVFDGDSSGGAPFSATDQVFGGASGGVTNSQRGFRFYPNEDVLVVSLGKNEPNGTTRYVTLFDFATQAILVQTQVSGPAATYSYQSVQPFFLRAGTQYLLELYQGDSDGYYFGGSTQINSHLTYVDMRYCNGCTQNDFPTNYLNAIHYGYPDLQLLARKHASPEPVVSACIDTATCDADGTPASCGDAYVNAAAGEGCDDVNTDETDACLSTCKAASCGDGFVHAGFEACDDANTVETDACLTTCILASCGDGFVQAGVETCDDANLDPTDACPTNCQTATCGDGFVQAGVEVCDDGNADTTDECIACEPARCGDGYVRAGIEACDDGNLVETDSCRIGCALPSCGDGILQPGELCEDGNDVATDGCTNSCMYARCGDGFIYAGVETCDDGNTVGGDGCDARCGMEIADAGVDGGTAIVNDSGCSCAVSSEDPEGPSQLAWIIAGLLGLVALRKSRHG